MENKSAENNPRFVIFNNSLGRVLFELPSRNAISLGSDGPLICASATDSRCAPLSTLFKDAAPKDMPDYLAAGYSGTLDVAKRQFSEACAPTFKGAKQTATSQHVYSTAGQLLSFDDITGTATTFTYDTNGRVVSSASSACQATSTYNDEGQLTQETIKDVCSGALMTVSYAYDLSGNETTRTFNGDGFPTLSLERTLYSDGRLKQFVLKVDGKEHRSDHYTYDSDQRLHKWYCTGENAPVSSSNKVYTEQVFTYDTYGNVVSRSHKSSKGPGVSTYGYDPDRPGALISSSGDPQLNDQSGRTLKRSKRKLGYHANGQIKSYSSQAGGEGEDYQFAYDTLGRIREVVLGEQREVYHYREGSIYAVQQLGDHFTGKAAKRRMVLLNNSPSCFLQQITEATVDVWESTTCTFELRDAAGTVFASLKHGQSAAPVYYSYLPYGFRVRDLASTTWLGFKGELLNPLSLYHLGNGDRLYDGQLHRYQVPAGAGLLANKNSSPYVYCNGDPVNEMNQAPTPSFVQSSGVFPWWVDTGSSVDNDALPRMSGFESKSLGAEQHTWSSPGYLLADRDLAMGERLQAWVISEYDGRIVKTVAWAADKDNLSQADWPYAFLSAINAAPTDDDDAKWMCAGYLSAAGELTVGKAGSPTTAEFDALDAAGKSELNRLWYYAQGCRLFSNAPFEANQVVAGRVPDFPPPEGERLSLQVRDRTTQYLYETYVFSPIVTEEAAGKSCAQQFCEFINASGQAADKHYGMVRAGVRGDDNVTVSPARSENALWVAQQSNLSVELESLTWQKHRDVGVFTPTVGATIQVLLYDRYSGTQLPGSPLSYTIQATDTEAAQCLASLAAALNASELGGYLRLGDVRVPESIPTSADEWALWSLPLPTRIIVIGVPSLSDTYEKALETPEGKALTLGDLYEGYKDGLSLTLCDRWSGHVIESWDFKPDRPNSESVEEAVQLGNWIEALGSLLASSLVMWGTQTARFNLPDGQASDLAKQSMWLPTEIESLLTARHLQNVDSLKSEKIPELEQRIIYKRNHLIWDEVQAYAFAAEWIPRTRKFNRTYSKLLTWGGEILSARDCYEVRPKLLSPKPTSVKAITYADFQWKANTANTPALVASRLSRADHFFMQYDVWQLQYPSSHWAKCLSCNEGQLVIQFYMPDHDYLSLLGALRLILKNRGRALHDDNELDPLTRDALQSTQVRYVLHEFKKLGVLNSVDEKLIDRIDISLSIRAAETLTAVMQIYRDYEKLDPEVRQNDKEENILGGMLGDMYPLFDLLKDGDIESDNFMRPKFIGLPTAATEIAASKSESLEISKRWLLGENPSTLDKGTWATVKGLGVLGSEHESLFIQLLCGDKILAKQVLHLQVTPAAMAKGVRFTSFVSDFAPDILSVYQFESDKRSWNGGIRLYIPEGVTLEHADGLCSASYISSGGITPAFNNNIRSKGPLGPAPLTIEMPFKGSTFIPQDSLCADYAGTLGSEVYDVSGASENGVDSKTGLFHAHYPLGVIRGLAGKGPELDLTLHYSATRANEGGLGDGWAFRFSSYDNRMCRLTLSNGQTITLTSEHVTKAQSSKRLYINGVTLTGAKGSHNELSELTVIFPSGRKETLAKPGKHDGLEASENYKRAFSQKVDQLKKNLEQWLKEPGVKPEQTKSYKKKIKELGELGKDMKRKAFMLTPTSITSPQGGTLTLAWEGKNGHVRLLSIHDGSAKLLSAVHDTPTAAGEYSSTFTVWPDTDESYDVSLSIQDCLLVRLTREGRGDATPVQSVVFGYEGEPVLDRVLCSVAEEDGSLETVSYGPRWKDWDASSDNLIPLSRVIRHTLRPGAGQQPITHIWEWQGSSGLAMKEGATFSATSSLETGSQFYGPSTTRTWTLRNDFIVETQVVKETPDLVRETTTIAYPDTITSTDPAVKYRLATQPLSTSVTTEDLRPRHTAATPPATPVESSAQESQS